MHFFFSKNVMACVKMVEHAKMTSAFACLTSQERCAITQVIKTSVVASGGRGGDGVWGV